MRKHRKVTNLNTNNYIGKTELLLNKSTKTLMFITTLLLFNMYVRMYRVLVPNREETRSKDFMFMT